jgi:hypothetical protein
VVARLIGGGDGLGAGEDAESEVAAAFGPFVVLGSLFEEPDRG